MPDRPDRRQVRSKQMLYHALMSLIEEKGSMNITVTEIASRADLNRGTFYLHYRDVPDMLQQLKDEVFERISIYVHQLDIQEAMKYLNKDMPYPNTVKVFEEITRHADFLRVMFGPHGDLSYTIRFRQLLTSHIYEKFSYMTPKNDTMPLDYLIAFMTSANIGMIMHWIESGLNQTPTQMANMMLRIASFGPLVTSGIKDIPASNTLSGSLRELR